MSVGPALLLAAEFPPERGGVSRVMSEVARRYPAGDLVVSTARARAAAGEGDLPAVVDRLPIGARQLHSLPGLLVWAQRAATLARGHHARFAWCGQLRPAAYVARWTEERVGTPYGILTWGAELLALRHRLHRVPLQRRTTAAFFRAASMIVAVSDWTREQGMALLGELGVEPRLPIAVVPLGADPARFRPGLDPDPVRHRYRLEEGRWLLTLGAGGPHKGVDTVLRALAEVAPRHPDLRYAVVGAGSRAPAFRRAAEALGLGGRVRFIADVAEGDLPTLYSLATIYVGVSRREGLSVEGFGIAMAEAAACGVPVIAGRSGGIPEMVVDGETGLLVDPERTGPLVQAIERLLDQPALAERLGAAARAAVERFYNWDRTVGALRALETRALGRGA